MAICIVGPVSAWDLVRQILDEIGAEWVESGGGGYPMVWRLDATREEARAHIDCSRITGRYSRETAVLVDQGTIYNRFSMQFNHGGRQVRAQATITIDATARAAADTADGRTYPSTRCAISQLVFGVRPAPTAVSEFISDPATAALVLRNMASRLALPRRALTVSGDLSLDLLEPNDVITLTASDVELTDELALVRSKRPGARRCEVDLLLLDSPLLSSRSTT